MTKKEKQQLENKLKVKKAIIISIILVSVLCVAGIVYALYPPVSGISHDHDGDGLADH